MNYYSAPEEAMDSAHAMADWARMALEAALVAKNTKKATKKTVKKAPIANVHIK
jgi:DNA transformation protein